MQNGMSALLPKADIQRRQTIVDTVGVVNRQHCERSNAAYAWPRLLGADMSRYKSSQSARVIEQQFTHFVDVVVPPGGLGPRLNAMYDFHTRHGIQPQRGQWRPGHEGGSITWCFADEALAGAFASEFNAKQPR